MYAARQGRPHLTMFFVSYRRYEKVMVIMQCILALLLCFSEWMKSKEKGVIMRLKSFKRQSTSDSVSVYSLSSSSFTFGVKRKRKSSGNAISRLYLLVPRIHTMKDLGFTRAGRVSNRAARTRV